MKRVLSLGQCLTSIGVLKLCERQQLDLGPLLDRHASGDWGDVDAERRAENDRALEEAGQIVSIYHPEGHAIVIITNPERTQTVVMLPREY